MLARRALGFWASDNDDDIESVFSPEYVNHQEPSIEGDVKNLDLNGWKTLVAGHHAAFSPSRVEILMQIAEADLVTTVGASPSSTRAVISATIQAAKQRYGREWKLIV